MSRLGSGGETGGHGGVRARTCLAFAATRACWSYRQEREAGSQIPDLTRPLSTGLRNSAAAVCAASSSGLSPMSPAILR